MPIPHFYLLKFNSNFKHIYHLCIIKYNIHFMHHDIQITA